MTELQHQITLFKWAAQPSIRQQYPELKYLFHIKNETREGAAAVSIDKRSGVKKGVPDLFLPVPCGSFHGLWIEMKAEKGRASEEQKWWLKEMIDHGYAAEVCHGWKEAKEELIWYLNLNK